MANEVDHFGSGWTDQETGITYSASGEALNAPDTGGSSHFDPSGQLILAGGEKVDMSAYAPITSPENYPGGFWGYYQHLIDTGQVNDDTQGLGGIAGYLRSHGYMVPLALMTAGAAAGAMGGVAAAEGIGATSAGIGAGTEGAAGLGGVAGGVGAGGAAGGAGAGTLAGIETTGAGGLAGGGGFVPAAGSGANFGIDVGANYGLASAAAPLETTGAGGLTGGGGFTPAVDSGANFAIDPTASYTTAGTSAVSAPIGDQPGDYPMPGEDGTASQWTPSNINPQDVTNLLDYNASLNPSTSLTDALKTANQVKQGVSTASSLAKLLSPSAGSALSGAAQNLATGQTGVGSAIPALIRGNQNPFLQTAQQPIRSQSPDLAALANLLKQG